MKACGCRPREGGAEHAGGPAYAASKAGGDRLAYAYFATYGLPVVVTRCSNNYGPRQYPEKLVPLFVTNAIDDEPLPVYGTGLNQRDWLHVDDHCAALIALLGENPTPQDYLALSLAAQDIAEALQVAFGARALPRDWLPKVRRVMVA